MTLQNVVDLAKNGVLKNIAIKNDVDAIVGYINLGLIELYKRFPMDTKEVILTLGSDGTVKDPYTMIDDVTYQMPSDFMYLVAAYDEVPEMSIDLVSPIPINEEDNPLSINTIAWNKIQIPVVVTGAYVSIIYASSPKYYLSSELAEDIPIPVQFVDALLAYLGYAGHASVSASEQENNVYYNRFEMSCNTVKTFGVFTTDDMRMGSRIKNGGFA